MKLKDMQIEDLELLSYADLSYLIIKENKKAMNTPILFKEVCNLLGYSDTEFNNKIGEYYTSLNIDKRFVLLESNEWEIRDNHSIEIVIDDDEEIEDETDDDIESEEHEAETDEYIEDEDDVDEVIDDEIDDDIEDLSIVSEDDLEED